MIRVEEEVPLAPHTTLGVGGAAKFFVTATTPKQVATALRYAREHSLKVAILGGGSNTLVPDAGFDGLVVKIAVEGITFTEEKTSVLVTAGAGVSWDILVREAGARGLWGIENLAAIPGTFGGAVVQNIGAYGAELSQTFEWADVIFCSSGRVERITQAHAAFAYRTSIFKKDSDTVITRAALRLARVGVPLLGYPDLMKAKARGEALKTPQEVAEAVRRVRALKFPQHEGTAGSFFKNPILEKSAGDALKKRFSQVPLIPIDEKYVKTSLAWILDRVLALKGYRKASARLYEAQPLVLVVDKNSSSADIDALADDVIRRVYEATGITIEREVETLRAR